MHDKNMTVGDHSVVITDLSKFTSEPCAIAIGEGAMVIEYGTFDDSSREELIELLKQCKYEHCIDNALNTKINAMIERLTRRE